MLFHKYSSPNKSPFFTFGILVAFAGVCPFFNGIASQAAQTQQERATWASGKCNTKPVAQEGSPQDEFERVEIPFQLTQWNNISVAAVINETEQVNLMFHLANSSVDIISESTERMKSVKFNKTGNAESWGGKSERRYSEGNSLKIGDFNWDQITIHEDKHSGRSTDGKFGPFLFGDKKIQINFDDQIITIRDDLPENIDEYKILEYELRRGSMFVTATLNIPSREGQNQAVDQEFMVHSGYSGSLLLDDQFVDDHQILERLVTLSESELKDSFGNVIKTKKVSLPAFEFAGIQFDDLPAGLFDGAIRKQKMSVLGMDVLKRFNIVIDRKDHKIYLQPNLLLDSDFFK